MKQEIPIKYATRLLNTGALVLVTARYNEKKTITPVAWQMPISTEIKLCSITLGIENFSTELIKETGVFCLNIVGKELIEQVKYCGSISGRYEDKFKLVGFSELPCENISVSAISSAFAHIECKVDSQFDIKDEVSLFIGKIIRVFGEEDLLINGILNIDKYKILHHLGDKNFGYLVKC